MGILGTVGTLGVKLFGLDDPVIILAHLLCIASALLCVVYGCINWNRGGEKETEQISEGVAWQEDEKKIDETL